MLATGRAVGEKIASGAARLVIDARSLAAFRTGRGIWSPKSTSPDWEPVMKTAAAIVTSHGGRTCHAAIVARELGVPAVVGAEGAVETARDGRTVTVSCADGEVGKVYDGRLPFEVASGVGDSRAAATHRDHGQSRQSRTRLSHRDAAQ